MRPSVTLKTAVSRMTVDVHRQIHSRSHATDYYQLAEREQQFQFDVGGSVGFVPVEASISVLFDIYFLYEYGTRRDSQLLEPHTRFGFTNMSAPPGSVPYAHVQSWNQDQDFNYIGCTIVVGVHNPTIGMVGADPTTNLNFTASLHASFQGYGAPIDSDS